MANYLIIDCHYLIYRNHYAMRNLEYEGERTGATFGFLRDLMQFQDLFDPDRMVFCFDQGKGKRTELYPSYKSSRKKQWTEEEWEDYRALQRQIDNLRLKYLRRLGFRNVLFQPGYEADDIIASVVRNSLAENDEAVIVSSDGDLLQLLSFNTVLYNPAKKKCTNAKQFRSQWGIEPCQWADVKAIAGCLTDDIKGIAGVGEITAAKWVSGLLNPKSDKYKLIDSGLDLINRNLRLVKLPFPGTETFNLRDDEPDKEEWEKLMGEMGIRTIRGMGRLGRPSETASR